jgi:flagellar motor switch protein FliN/FliY
MADENELINQDEIERLLQSGQGGALQEPPAASGTAPTGDDADRLLGQDEIERLLNDAGKGAAPPKPASPKPQASNTLAGEGQINQSDIEYLLNQATEALHSIDSPSSTETPSGVTAFRFQEFGGMPANAEVATLDLISDVELDLRIELGRTHMYLEDVLKLRKGSVVPLEKLAGDPVDVFVNGRLVARGEVLVMNDNFCVRVAELIAGTNSE